jgi:hypothetical protein
MTLKEKLKLTPDQFEQFDSLEPFQIEHLTALHPAEQELIGELWRASKEVGETNFRGTLDDRIKACTALRIVKWKLAILNGIHPHFADQKLTEKEIDDMKAGLRVDEVSFNFWSKPVNGERLLLGWMPNPFQK